MAIDTQLASYATVRQLEIIEAIEKHGSNRKAAAALGVSPSAVDKAMRELKIKAARNGYAPGHFEGGVAPGYLMGKVTVQRGPGGVERVWERQHPDEAQREAMFAEAIEVLSDGFRGLAPVVKRPARVAEDLLCVIPVGDPHFGLYTWAKECGDDFDTDIARRLSIGAADRIVASAPACGIGILLLLGDITHANDQTNATPAHKHQLDVDSRFVRVLGIAIETWRHILLRMLQKHGRVIGKLLPGNHDPQAVWALAYALHAYFHNDPRVEIDLGPSKFWYYSFGRVLIGSTHGDTVKPERLPGIMAADRPQEWGAAAHRYWYTGHIHSKNAIEFPGVQWESFRTLAAPDAYAAGHGYRAGRDMVAIVHHREFGEVERHRCDVGMVA
jgi:hypothetical protein